MQRTMVTVVTVGCVVYIKSQIWKSPLLEWGKDTVQSCSPASILSHYPRSLPAGLHSACSSSPLSFKGKLDHIHTSMITLVKGIRGCKDGNIQLSYRRGGWGKVNGPSSIHSCVLSALQQVQNTPTQLLLMLKQIPWVCHKMFALGVQRKPYFTEGIETIRMIFSINRI